MNQASHRISLIITFIFIAVMLWWSHGAVKSVSAQGGGRTTATPRPNPPSTGRSPSTNRGGGASSGTPEARRRQVVDKIAETLVLIPSGTFMMGSPDSEPGRVKDEGPQHSISVQSFYMGKYEVTQAQWQAVMGSNPSSFGICATCPVEKVSWNDAQKFIRRLNGMQSAFTYRLPTESEWEYACRAGTTKGYAGSLDAMAWYAENSLREPHPVGSMEPNSWGLYDMHGNVWEWCQSKYGPYPYSADGGREEASAGDISRRVMRGGGYNDPARYVRSAVRYYYSPGYLSGDVGFRLAASSRR